MRKKKKDENKLLKKKNRSTFYIFARTFIVAFAILTVVSLGATMAMEKLGGFKPFEKKGGKDKTHVLEEELELDTLVDKNNPFYSTYKNSKRVNFLFLGTNGGLTDMIMLASFNMEDKKVDIISVPRDTYYERSGYTGAAERKINAAYKGNPVNTAKAISNVLYDIPINYYAVIDYKGVENIVDSMGGVPMDIPDIGGRGGMYYNDPYDKPPLKIALPAGHMTLDGKQAVQFLRFRKGYADGDIGREEAQQKFVKSAFKQTMGLNLPKVAKTVFKNVNSDITLGKSLSIAAKAAGMKDGDMRTYHLPATPQGEAPWYMYPDDDEIKRLISDIYDNKKYLTPKEREEKAAQEAKAKAEAENAALGVEE